MRKKFKRSTALLLAMIMVFSLVCDPGIVALAEESVTSGEVIVDADENISAYTTEEIETTVEGVTESEETEEIITGIETGTEIEEEKVEVTEENETETTEQQEEQEEIEATENEDEAAEIIDETDEEQLQKEEKNGECIESCLEGCIGETCECQCHATNTEAPTCIEECDQECSGEECECTCHTMVKTLLQRATDILENARQMDENTSQRNLGNVYKDLSTLNDEIGAAYQNGEITENEYQYLGSQMNVIANEAIGIIMGLGYDPYAIDETETHTSFTRWDTNPYFDYVPGGFYNNTQSAVTQTSLENIYLYSDIILGAKAADSVTVVRPTANDVPVTSKHTADWSTLVSPQETESYAWAWDNNTTGGSAVNAWYSSTDTAGYNRIKDKNQYYVRYNNIGTLSNGTKVDLKLSVVDYAIADYDRIASDQGKDSIFYKRYPIISFQTNPKLPGINVLNVEWVQLRYEFFVNGTNTLIPNTTKGYTTYYDIDNYQAICFDSTAKGFSSNSSSLLKQGTVNVSDSYASAYGTLNGTVIGEVKGYRTGNDDLRTAVTEIFQGNTLIRTFSFQGGDVSSVGSIYNRADPVYKGNLTVDKTVSGNGSNANQLFSFTVSLNKPFDGTFGDMTFVDGKCTFSLSANGGTKTAKGLPANLGYTVTETAATGYTTTWANQTGTIPNGSTKTVTCNNAYIQYILKVSKTVVGTNRSFTFKLDASGSAYDQTFTLSNGQSKSITLPYGTTYNVTETAVSGYATTTSGDAVSGTMNGNKTISFTNTQQLTLKVTKTVVGANKSFTFKLDASGSAYDQTFTLSNGQSRSITLPYGTTYNVTETADASYITTTSGDATSGTMNGNKTVNFTNTQKMTLTVKKTVVGADKEFTFTVDCSNNSYDTSFKLKNGGSKSVTIPYGTTYKVTETADSSYITTTSGDATSGTMNGNKTVNFTNTQKMILTVKKIVLGNGGSTSQEFTFKLAGTVNGSDVSNAPYVIKNSSGTQKSSGNISNNGTFKLAHGDYIEITLPYNTSYTVVETAVTGYIQSYASQNGILTANETKTFTNTLVQKKLTVSKIVTGDGADLNKEFTFTFNGKVNNTTNVTNAPYKITPKTGATIDGSISSGETFTLADGDKIEIEIPYNTTYTVTENDYSSDGYITKVGNSEGRTASGTLTEIDGVAIFTNEYKLSCLTLKKEVSGNMGNRNQPFIFTVKFSNSGDTVDYLECDESKVSTSVSGENGIYTVALKDNEEVTFSVIYGTEYEIIENDYSSQGYETAIEGAEDINGTIATGTLDSDAVTVTYTNTKQVATPTGIILSMTPYLLMLFGAVTLVILFLYKRPRRN